MPPKIVLIILITSTVFITLILFFHLSPPSPLPSSSLTSETSSLSPTPTFPSPPPTISQFYPPLPQANLRVTKKTFGQYITPQNSPVQPERFTGYHTGVDFEVFPDELHQDVFVSAICTGPIIQSSYVSGYGGVAIQSCTLDEHPITILYGHLNLASIQANVGDTFHPGDSLALLGNTYSSQTDGERKHLHLGIQKGTSINLKGYVSNSKDLSQWIDPCLYLCSP